MFYAGLIAALAAGDQGLKWLIERQDQDGFPRPLARTGGRIWLHRHHNTGFPFGFLKNHGELVRTVPLAVISGLCGVLEYLVLKHKKEKTVQKLGLSLVLGGAFSNLYDRYIRRYVVDYFSIQAGFLKNVIFNLGDILVFAGSALLMCAELAG
ncbi:MAG: signal peptidase II, partial [Eubacteriales bacterium]|nr:signal peptidase II [Eubacteriales bacterium]